MDTVIAKLKRPLLSGVIERKRLLSLLDNKARKIVWVSAPGGYGKTTLIANWLDVRKLPCLWYQIDEGDSDPATFFHYLGLAAKKAAPRHRKPLPLLTPEHLPDIPLFTRNYFLELFARLKPPFAIVFDNYQDSPPGSKLHAVLNTALSVIPEGITVFVLSRREPEAEFARLRANGDITVIGWEELRFTFDESAGVVRSKGLHLAQGSDERVQQTTEGWIAGLVLILEQMKRGNAVDEHIGNLGIDAIFDYFATILFNNADKETRDFLLKTAFLPQMSAHMAGLLTGNANAGNILSRLNRDNFFTYKIAGQNVVYQYHQLFREYLLSRAEETYTREELSNIRFNAASLLESTDRIEDAVEIFRKDEDWKSVTRLIREHALPLQQQGRSEVIRGWLKSLPGDIIERDARLLYWQGVCLASLNVRESRRNLASAFERFKNQNERLWMFLAWAEIADGTIVEMVFSEMYKWRIALEDILGEDPSFPNEKIELRITMSLFNSMAFSEPDNPAMKTLSDRALELVEREVSLVDINCRLMTCVHLNAYYLWTGSLSKAELITKLLGRLSHNPQVSDLTLLSVKSSICLYHLFTGEHEMCLKNMSEGLQAADKAAIDLRRDQILGHGLSSALSKGDWTNVEKLYSQFSKRAEKALRFDQAYFHLITAWKAMHEGDLAEAYEHQVIAFRRFEGMGHIAAQAIIHFGLADILFHLKRYQEADAELSRGFEIARRMKSAHLEVMGSLIEAQIAFGQKDENRGMEALARAMSNGREHGFVNMHWWRPSLVTPLCIRALEAGIEVEYVRNLITKRKLIPETPPLHVENWPWTVKIFTLGKFGIMKDGKHVVFPGRVQQKPLALLKAIIAHGASDVDDALLTDAVWPEAEGDLGRRSFDTNLHRLRKVLGDERAVQLRDGKVTLGQRCCWIDALAFERMYAEAKTSPAEPKNDCGYSMLEKAIKLYHGHFLPGDHDASWSVSFRERLRSKYFSAVNKLGRHHMDSKDYEPAVEIFQHGLEVDDLSEEFYQNLMVCYHKLGRKSEAAVTYRRCCSTLANALGIAPSERTEEIHRKTANSQDLKKHS